MGTVYHMLLSVLILFYSITPLLSASQSGSDDNEFAEFEDFDDDDKTSPKEKEVKEETRETEEQKQPSVEDEGDDEAATVEVDDEFEHFSDEDEFEGFDKDKTAKPTGKDKIPDLTITKIPIHLLTSWDSYMLELLMISGLVVYFLNFLLGKSKNNVISQAWFSCHRDILEAHFSLIGDDESLTEAPTQPGTFIKKTENVYALWCSGRTCVEGMLVELKLLKRQDIINCIQRVFRPAQDQVLITVYLDPNIMGRYVFCIGQKRIVSKLHKDMYDLSIFCEKKSVEHLGLPSSYNLLTEIAEASNAILDNKVLNALKRYEGWIDYIHISDQFSGPKVQDDSQQKKTVESKPVLIFCFNILRSGRSSLSEMKEMKEMLKLVFHCIEKVDKYNLSREAKLKSDKNRQKSEAVIHKAKHAERQEAAQQRKDDKRRAEKERLMNEDDPEKARKLEERDYKREMKKRQPKMKTMKAMM